MIDWKVYAFVSLMGFSGSILFLLTWQSAQNYFHNSTQEYKSVTNLFRELRFRDKIFLFLMTGFWFIVVPIILTVTIIDLLIERMTE
jgi:hypothetical protein